METQTPVTIYCDISAHTDDDDAQSSRSQSRDLRKQRYKGAEGYGDADISNTFRNISAHTDDDDAQSLRSQSWDSR